MPGTEPTAVPLNRLRTVWRDGKCTLGAIVTIPSPQLIQVMARSGLDWVIIDMEHGAIDAAAAHAMIAATTGTPLVPFVRVSATTSWQAKLPLDLGAMGVCFPMTTRRADAEAAVRTKVHQFALRIRKKRVSALDVARRPSAEYCQLNSGDWHAGFSR